MEKKSYYSLGSIFGRSGVGFNSNGDYKIEVDNDQWDQIVKNDPNARFMRYKSWPLWNDWKLVFGNDLASGDVPHDTNDAFDHLSRQTHVNTRIDGIEVNGFKDYSTPEIPPPNEVPITVDDITEQNPNAANQGKQSGKKRKASTDSNGLIEMLTKMQEDTNLRLDRLTDKIGYDFDVSKSRKEVFEKLGVVPGLTLQ
ncbi:hypothetical protein SASPL_122900 [Salvia splendens]|uniref:Uncharacterized protein n=1 Tax=Salvia splendens TaxID=180675 RepID=A0A8X8XM80_SALSN|nr:uncharacterized protein LOC121745706 [Salvia splendens]KAG6415489.1 hypothetical protein SASPL_122900 [Salvia splendens]